MRQFDEHMAGEFHHQGMVFETAGARSSSCSTSGSGGCPLIPMTSFYGNPGGGSLNLGGSDGGLIFSPGVAQNSLDSCSTLLVDSVPGLKHDTGLAVEWSVDEQFKLEEGLAKYANEPAIMQYIKIAASLRDKTVRDVALRCSWMAGKRRKQGDQSLGKKSKNQKELAESSLKISSSSPVDMVPYSFPTNHSHQSGCMLQEVFSGTTRHLLEENNQAFGQISANLLALKLQENLDLFFLTRKNIVKILNEINNMPGIMSRMPPLPVFLNDDLASSIFLHLSK
ncbi:uncharacterized protein LOC127260542 [Andrographis paniculata]|uniref:uncharacterized protein LOC127260542 n=1 Tax=Andrographis paniculata TaxID=175694 RepID=UPI0021E98465|nr:uncharacterized protein LOC127260542 [Andrographis paniculata]